MGSRGLIIYILIITNGKGIIPLAKQKGDKNMLAYRLIKTILFSLNKQYKDYVSVDNPLKQREDDFGTGIYSLASSIGYEYERRKCFDFDKDRGEYFYWLPEGNGTFRRLFYSDIIKENLH